MGNKMELAYGFSGLITMKKKHATLCSGYAKIFTTDLVKFQSICTHKHGSTHARIYV